MAFSYRDVTVYPPFPGEVPEDLVGEGAALADVRIAKTADGEVAGAYRLAKVDACRFVIEALAVYPSFRGCGVGRWLLGHAIGIAESRGGRVVDAPDAGREFFLKAGFAPECGRLRLRLTPE